MRAIYREEEMYPSETVFTVRACESGRWLGSWSLVVLENGHRLEVLVLNQY